MRWTRTSFAAADGVRLAGYRAGNPAGPPVLLVHGYPDSVPVWSAVAERLVENYRLFALDVRGAGESDRPTERSAYRVEQLADDISWVAATAGRPVHVIAHDWGSTQVWRAVTADDATEHFASFTSISGPDLGMAGAWLHRHWRTDRRLALQQLAKSWYLLFFRLPWLPELMWRSGLGVRLTGRPRGPQRTADAVAGLNLYRANLGRGSAPQRPRRCAIPVLVLAPQHDRYVGVDIQTQAPEPWTPLLQTQIIAGGHWTMEKHPERITDPAMAFIDAVEAGLAS